MTAPSSILIVSGLPRSGTSLAMGMLNAGGQAVLEDHKRPPDRHNAKGYFEHSRVKRLMRESNVLDEATGKAVKIIAPLLPYVPKRLPIRLIIMHRDLQEVVASQAAMLGESHPQGHLHWAKLLQKELDSIMSWLHDHTHWHCTTISFHEVLQDPMHAARQLQSFAQRDLDIDAMARWVEPTLHHQRRV